MKKMKKTGNDFRMMLFCMAMAMIALAPFASAARIIGLNQVQNDQGLSLNSTTLNIFTSNASRVYITQAGMVGIGTATPQQKLTLMNASNLSVEMSPPGSLSIVVSNATGSNLTNSTYYYKITALDGAGGETIASEEISIFVNGTISNASNISWGRVPGAASYRVWNASSSGGQNSYSNTTSTSFVHSGSEAFVSGTLPGATTAYVNKISASGNSWILGGNVGINTTSPRQALVVVGDLNVTGTSYLSGITIRSDNITTNNVLSKDGGIIFYNNLFQEIARMASTGSVGINTTSPTAALHVIGTLNATPAASAASTSLFVNATGGVFYKNGEVCTAENSFCANAGNGWADDGTIVRLVTQSDFVGIGTSAPSEKLYVSGNGTFTGDLVVNGNLLSNGGQGFGGNVGGWADDGTIIRLATASDFVGIGTASPQNTLEIIGAATFAGGVNASSLNVTGFSITDDSLVTLSDGSKKKIKDVMAGEEVLTLEETTGKLVPRKVNALLDHGIKPIYEMATEDGRAINTTAEHPYYVKKIEYHSIPNNFLMSDVESTLTLLCCLCLFSSDHNSYSSDDNANAKYAASLRWCGNISKASGRNLEYLDSGTILIFLNNSFITNSSSALVNPLYFSSLSSRFPISPNMNLGEYSLAPAFDSSLIILNINPRLINAWNTMFASTTNSILETYIPCSLAIEDLTSSANSKACSFVNLLLDTILSAKENSTSSMNSLTTLFKAASKSSFNSGEISTLNFNSAILTSPKDNNENDYLKLSNTPLGEWIEVRYLKVGDYIAVPDYENCGKENARTKSGTNFVGKEKSGFHSQIITSANNRLASQLGDIDTNSYINLSENGQSQGRIARQLREADDLLASQPRGFKFSSREEIPAPGAQNSAYEGCGIKWVKIASIKQLPEQHVYDLSIEGTRNFIANDIVAHNTYLATSSGNVGIGTAAPTDKLDVNGNVTIRGNFTVGNNILFVNNNGSGNVGIGTTEPTSAIGVGPVLHVKGNAGGGVIRIQSSNGASGGIIIIDENEPLRLFTNNAEAMRIAGSGNVGIGDTTPDFALEVVSNFSVSSAAGNDGDRFILNSAGNVGIGTTTPTDKLQVMGNFSVRNQSDATDVFMFISNATGRVGIGTTAPGTNVEIQGIQGTGTKAAAVSGARLFGQIHVAATDAFSTQKGGVISFGGEYDDTGNLQSTFGTIRGKKANAIDAESGGGLEFLTAKNSDGSVNVNMVIDNTGNVGINTTAPGSTLTVAGTLNASGSGTGPGLYVNGAGKTLLGYGTGISVSGNTAHQLQLATSSSSARVFPNLYFAADTDGAMLVLGKSRSGTIGTMTYPTSGDILGDIFFSGASSGNSRFDVGAAITATAGTTWTDSNYETNMSFATTARGSTGRATAMTIASTGNVGIGTTGPGSPLHVVGTNAILAVGSNAFTARDTNNDNDAVRGALVFQRGTGAGTALTISSIADGSNGVKAISIDGNVGIGTTGPDKKLHILDATQAQLIVSGWDDIQGAYTDSGSIQIGGDTIPGTSARLHYDGELVGILYIDNGFNDANADIRFRTKTVATAVDVMTLEAGGNVGIGTTAPATTLDVKGTTKLNGTTQIGEGTKGIQFPVLAYFNTSNNQKIDLFNLTFSGGTISQRGATFAGIIEITWIHNDAANNANGAAVISFVSAQGNLNYNNLSMTSAGSASLPNLDVATSGGTVQIQIVNTMNMTGKAALMGIGGSNQQEILTSITPKTLP